MTETDKILGRDERQNPQFQVAEYKEAIKKAKDTREAEHKRLRESLEYLSEHARGHGTGDLEWELKDLKWDIAFAVDCIKNFVLHDETP